MSAGPAAVLRRLTASSAAAGVPWGVVDQALSSGTNFLLAFLVVSRIPPEEFGVFSLVVVVYVLATGVARALGGEPLMIRFSNRSGGVDGASGACLGLAAALGLAGGAVCAAVALGTAASTRGSFAVLAAAFPLLLVQDAVRLVCFARFEPRRAALNDLAWAVLQLVAVAAALAAGRTDSTSFVAAWAFGGALAGAVGLAQLRRRPALGAAPGWLRAHGRLGLPLLGTYLLTTAVSYVLFALLPLVADLAELGRVRAAYLPFGAFGIVLQSAWLVLLPAATRAGGARRLHHRAAVWSGALAGLAAAWAVAVLLAPEGIGRWVLGPEWDATRPARWCFAAALVAYAAGVGPVVALRALEATGPLVRVRAVATPVVLGVGLVLAARTGATGAAAGIMAGDVLTAGASWFVLGRLAAGRGARGEGAAGNPPPSGDRCLRV